MDHPVQEAGDDRPTVKRLARLLSVWTIAEASIAVVSFLVVVGALLADVAGRELIGQGVSWAQRLASYGTTLAGMLGFALVVQYGGHLRPKSIDRLFSPRWDGAINRVGDLLQAAICLALAWYGTLFVERSAALGQRGMSIEIVVWPIQIIIPYVFASGGIRYLIFAVCPAARPMEHEEGAA